MVIPLALSSGAASISSNFLASALPAAAKTPDIAAVNVERVVSYVHTFHVP